MSDMTLWCKVYDGPIYWNDRDAFQQIRFLELAIEHMALQLEEHPDPEHIKHIVSFAHEVWKGKRPGFESFIQDQLCPSPP